MICAKTASLFSICKYIYIYIYGWSAVSPPRDYDDCWKHSAFQFNVVDCLLEITVLIPHSHPTNTSVWRKLSLTPSPQPSAQSLICRSG